MGRSVTSGDIGRRLVFIRPRQGASHMEDISAFADSFEPDAGIKADGSDIMLANLEIQFG